MIGTMTYVIPCAHCGVGGAASPGSPCSACGVEVADTRTGGRLVGRTVHVDHQVIPASVDKVALMAAAVREHMRWSGVEATVICWVDGSTIFVHLGHVPKGGSVCCIHVDGRSGEWFGLARVGRDGSIRFESRGSLSGDEQRAVKSVIGTFVDDIAKHNAGGGVGTCQERA